MGEEDRFGIRLSRECKLNKADNTVTVTTIYNLSIKNYSEYQKLPPEAKDIFKNLLLEMQNGKCAYCDGKENYRDWVVDHDHKTDRIRGLVHQSCNSQIGQIERHLDYFKQKS